MTRGDCQGSAPSVPVNRASSNDAKNECDHLHGHTSAGGELGKQKRRPDASKRRLQLSYREASMHDFVLVVPVIIVVLVTITHNISATPNQRAGAPI